MLTRQQKEAIVSESKQKVEDAQSLVFVDYKGVTVFEMSQLKKELREKGVQFQVIKKKIFVRAAADAGIEVSLDMLPGQLAVAYSLEDEVSAAKIIQEFAKKNQKMTVLGGVLENNVIDADAVQALSKLPTKEELLGMLVRTLQGPQSGFVNVLAGNIRGLVQVLKAVSEK